MKKIALAIAIVFVASIAIAAEEHSCKSAEKGKAVEMTGKLLCRHCNLHQTETCEKVFQPANDEKTLYAVCKGSKVDLEKVSEEGNATLNIKGKLVKCSESGKDELVIEEATKVVEAAK